MKPEQSEFFLIEELFKQSQKNGAFTDVKLLEVDKLTGDASTRRYYRLYTDKVTLVVCLDNPYFESENKHPFLSVQKFLFNQGIAVPQIFDHNLGRGYLLQEDLGNVTLINYLSGIENSSDEKGIYLQIIDRLIRLHKIKKEEVLNPELFNLTFDFEKLISECQFTFKYFINLFLNNKDDEYIKSLEENITPLIKRISSQKMVITHRDFHSRNIMMKNNNLFFIDFQDARWGIPQYDLVSLLEDCYYDIDPENREMLKRYYFEKMGPDFLGQENFEIFSSLYNDMTIQRVFKAIGSFCYIYNWRKDERYLKYIGFGMEKIRRLMMNNPNYYDLKKLLFNYYYGN
jgi:aminoglycoside/choline kinase family phosphotransferase